MPLSNITEYYSEKKMGKPQSRQKPVELDQQSVNFLLSFSCSVGERPLSEIYMRIIDMTRELRSSKLLYVRTDYAPRYTQYVHGLCDPNDCTSSISCPLFETNSGYVGMPLSWMLSWAERFEQEYIRTGKKIDNFRLIAEVLRDHHKVILEVIAHKKYMHEHAREIEEANRIAKRNAKARAMLQ